MSAILGRMIAVEGGPLATEYLARNEALFAECEWVWTRDRDAAFRFDFSTHEEEVAAIEKHTEERGGRRVRPWAINLPRVEAREIQHPTSNVQHPTSKAQATGGGDQAGSVITERIRRAKVRKKTMDLPERKADERGAAAPGGAARWREVYRARVAPEDVYARTERRCGS